MKVAKQFAGSLATDLPILFSGLTLFYGLLALARYWAGPVHTHVEIRLDPWALPVYAACSVARIAVAYLMYPLVYAR